MDGWVGGKVDAEVKKEDGGVVCNKIRASSH